MRALVVLLVACGGSAAIDAGPDAWDHVKCPTPTVQLGTEFDCVNGTGVCISQSVFPDDNACFPKCVAGMCAVSSELRLIDLMGGSQLCWCKI